MRQAGLDNHSPFGNTGVARHRCPPWEYGIDATAHTMPHRGVSCHLFDDVVPSFFKNLLQKAPPPRPAWPAPSPDRLPLPLPRTEIPAQLLGSGVRRPPLGPLRR